MGLFFPPSARGSWSTSWWKNFGVNAIITWEISPKKLEKPETITKGWYRSQSLGARFWHVTVGAYIGPRHSHWKYAIEKKDRIVFLSHHFSGVNSLSNFGGVIFLHHGSVEKIVTWKMSDEFSLQMAKWSVWRGPKNCWKKSSRGSFLHLSIWKKDRSFLCGLPPRQWAMLGGELAATFLGGSLKNSWGGARLTLVAGNGFLGGLNFLPLMKIKLLNSKSWKNWWYIYMHDHACIYIYPYIYIYV